MTTKKNVNLYIATYLVPAFLLLELVWSAAGDEFGSCELCSADFFSSSDPFALFIVICPAQYWSKSFFAPQLFLPCENVYNSETPACS